MKKKNNYKNYNRYEVKDKTSKFVKEKLPAYVLALLMVFWTIASVLGIVAFCNRDKKESAMNIVTANADEVNTGFALRNFDIPLYGFVGMSGRGDNTYYMDNVPYLLIRNNNIWVLPYLEYYNGREDTSFLGQPLTAGNGAITSGSTEEYSMFVNSNSNRDRNFTFNAYGINPFVNDVASDYDYYYPSSIEYRIEFVSMDSISVNFELRVHFEFVYNDSVVEHSIFGFYFATNDFQFEDSGESAFLTLPFFNFYAEGLALNLNNYSLGSQEVINAKADAKAYFESNRYFDNWQNAVGDLSSLRGEYDYILSQYRDTVEQLRLANENVIRLRNENGDLRRIGVDLQTRIDTLSAEVTRLENQLNIRYEEGKRAGYVNGYDVGYAEGALNANNYTFDGLLSAVFDVPVRTFKSLFEFEILGVNLANFFLSLLTLAIIIFIVRWIL